MYAADPFVYYRFWEEKYQPRYVLPWSFMTAFWFISPAMCLIIRFYLMRENRRREALVNAAADGAGVDGSENEAIDTGSEIVKIGGKDLDRTDRENLRFVVCKST